MGNAFIGILQDHLQGRKTSYDSEFDLAEILRLSQIHNITGIVYQQCKNFIPDEKESDWCQMFGATLYYYARREEAMQFVSTILNDAGIRFFPVKGLEVAKYYPFPCLRTMGDNDVVIEPGMLDEAVHILRGKGFQDSGDSGRHVWSCCYKEMHFEFHDRLIGGDARTAEQIEFFDNFMPYVTDNTLDWNFHFLFLIMHLRKHFMNSGVGIRQFMDIAVVGRGNKELDWNWIEGKLIELKLQKFAHVCYSLIEKWFEIKMPVQYEKIDDELVAEVTDKILGNGVFGYEDDGNRDNWVSNILIQAGGGLQKNRITFFINKLFPDYKTMKRYPGCEFLSKYPYLLPVAWVRRFVYIICDGKNMARKYTVTGTFKATSELEKRRIFLERMGLLDS